MSHFEGIFRQNDYVRNYVNPGKAGAIVGLLKEDACDRMWLGCDMQGQLFGTENAEGAE